MGHHWQGGLTRCGGAGGRAEAPAVAPCHAAPEALHEVRRVSGRVVVVEALVARVPVAGVEVRGDAAAVGARAVDRDAVRQEAYEGGVGGGGVRGKRRAAEGMGGGGWEEVRKGGGVGALTGGEAGQEDCHAWRLPRTCFGSLVGS